MKTLRDLCHDTLLRGTITNIVKSTFHLPLDLIEEYRLKEAQFLCGSNVTTILIRETYSSIIISDAIDTINLYKNLRYNSILEKEQFEIIGFSYGDPMICALTYYYLEDDPIFRTWYKGDYPKI